MIKIKLLDVDLIRRFSNIEIVVNPSEAHKLVDAGKAKFLSNIEIAPPQMTDKNIWQPPENKFFAPKEDYPKEDDTLFEIT